MILRINLDILPDFDLLLKDVADFNQFNFNAFLFNPRYLFDRPFSKTEGDDIAVQDFTGNFIITLQRCLEIIDYIAAYILLLFDLDWEVIEQREAVDAHIAGLLRTWRAVQFVDNPVLELIRLEFP